MPRTPEQIAADHDLNEAVLRCAKAYEEAGDESFVLDWAVVVVKETLDSPGEETYQLLLPGGVIPTYRVVGLMEVGKSLCQE